MEDTILQLLGFFCYVMQNINGKNGIQMFVLFSAFVFHGWEFRDCSGDGHSQSTCITLWASNQLQTISLMLIKIYKDNNK